jgi:MFS family permease
MFKHPLIETLRNLRGNARGCVTTEPLWGIPYNLYAPYVSVYMLALGLTDVQIGMLISVSLACQVVTALLSGAITDKFGRKRTTLISDLISWSVPVLIWAVAQDFRYFLVAAVINSVWRVSMTSWSCLLVEDTHPRLLVDIYSWIYISNYVAAFFAPIAGLLIMKYSLVPTMRALYLLAFVMMTTKFFLMNTMVDETQQGSRRLEQTNHQSLFTLLKGYRGVLGQIIRTPITIYTLGLMIVMSINLTVLGAFWSIMVTQRLLVAPQYLSIFTTVKSAIMLLFFFLIMPRIREMDVRKPLITGFIFFIISLLLLIWMPPQSYVLLIITVILEACAIPMTSTFMDKLVVVSIDPQERARIMAILYVFVILMTSPFGWVAGQLSQMNRVLPFIMVIALFLIGIVLIILRQRVPVLIAEQHGSEPVL